MGKTRNEFMVECKEIISLSNNYSTTINNLLVKFEEALTHKNSDLMKFIKQLENETGHNLFDLEVAIKIKKQI